MARKRTRRTQELKNVDTEKLAERLQGQRAFIGLDVAKRRQVFAVMTPDREVTELAAFEQPRETGMFFEFCERLRATDLEVEVVMEATGTYGEPLRAGLLQRGFDVFRVGTKRVRDSAELYDGVPSHHDAKSAALIGFLHALGRSEPWPPRAEKDRKLRVETRLLELWDRDYRSRQGQLEALTAAYWPELCGLLALDRTTTLMLLATYGGPAGVAANHAAARKLMRRTGRSVLKEATIDAVLRSAEETTGMAMLREECDMVKQISSEAAELKRKCTEQRKRLEKTLDGDLPTMCAAVGAGTTAILKAHNLDPRDFSSPKAYEKSMGLNLRQDTSGERTRTGFHITKRGNPTARRYLHLAALRLIKTDPTVRAWYLRKVDRDGPRQGLKAVTAIVRKLARALWYLARGEPFDATKLFDVKRLKGQLASA